MIKHILRRWLGISDTPQQAHQQHEFRLSARVEGLLHNCEADSQNALMQVAELQQKFDAMADLLGVIVVADHDGQPPQPAVVSIRDTSIVEGAERYINAAVFAHEFLSVQRRQLEQQREAVAALMKDLNAPNKRRP